MKINADFEQRVVVQTASMDWIPSPTAGVERRMLDRVGEEVARATSIVRYAPGSAFPEHVHSGGEEFFVLEGTFSDEHGDYPAGTYVRNPVGSSHSPRSEGGCTIYVKLRQMHPNDFDAVRVYTADEPWHPGLVEGLSVLPLHTFGTENVALVRWAPGTVFQPHTHWGGEEILVVQGTFEDEHGTYPEGTWIRSPHASRHTPFSRTGCTILVKTGHLADGEYTYE